MSTSPHQLSLLADHLKLSLLERQRALSLNLEPTKHDAEITRSLTTLQTGLQDLESQQAYSDDTDTNPELSRLRKQHADLYTQFHGTAPPTRSSAELRRSEEQDLDPDFEAAQHRPSQARRSKSVRFRDNDDTETEDPVAQANRAALFSDPTRYRDEPSAPDQSGMDNQQIHAHHTTRLREQDEDLDNIGRSITRQRMLGMQMGEELDEQNVLLGDVESGVDRHAGTLERARKRLGGVARKGKDNWSWVTIGILICVLVLLIVVLK
ncbi:hypothetical protein B0A50_05947 [Salinomyces thailandicus]|uniref:t-SNARE coiled-coil homology domain-containing protein n=1 Tax=Salinomyces thailandicus TaxID=706561 RepID=A0A4V5N402_9PEZI|nr:hypothetical protein B0A50_05947 [Salinomyces thailandica]